ncbi:MAG: endolytic transglycosylase MltG [Acidimicrobiales bacterium]
MRTEFRRRRLAVAAVGIGTAVALVAGIAGLWVSKKIDPSGSPGPIRTIVIPSGATSASIGSLLEDADIITDSNVFRWYVRLKGGAEFQAGRYELARRSSMSAVLDALQRPPRLVTKRLTIPEGLTVAEAVALTDKVPWLSSERLAALVASGTVTSRWAPDGVTSLEGLLFPDTYQIDENEDEADLLARMIARFDAVAVDLGYDRAEQSVGRSAYEVMVVASLVEAEAKVDGDRGKIARVIYNRLEKRMTLGIDATVYYALGRKGGSLTRSDLAINSPYNTRKVAGLPPTPIALPGRASLAAALNPEAGPWLYYVLADEQGNHAFSESYDDFLANKAAAGRKGLL